MYINTDTSRNILPTQTAETNHTCVLFSLKTVVIFTIFEFPFLCHRISGFCYVTGVLINPNTVFCYVLKHLPLILFKWLTTNWFSDEELTSTSSAFKSRQNIWKYLCLEYKKFVKQRLIKIVCFQQWIFPDCNSEIKCKSHYIGIKLTTYAILTCTGKNGFI